MFLGPESYIEKKTTSGNISQFWHTQGSLVIAEVLKVYKMLSLPKEPACSPFILAGDIKINQGPRFLCRLCKKYCNATDKFVTCNDCEKRFYATCANPVQYDKCEMWVHNKGSLVSETQYENIQNSNCSWICPKCDFFNFSDSFFSDKLNLEEQNRFAPCQTIVAVVLKLVNLE